MGIGLGSIERGEYLSADDDHRTEPASLRARCNPNCLEKIRRAIPSEVAHGAHRTSEHNGLIGRQRAGDEVC